MALSIVKMFRKEDTEAKPAAAEEVQMSDAGEVTQEEAKKGGHGHGEGTCCGSCS